MELHPSKSDGSSNRKQSLFIFNICIIRRASAREPAAGRAWLALPRNSRAHFTFLEVGFRWLIVILTTIRRWEHLKKVKSTLAQRRVPLTITFTFDHPGLGRLGCMF